MIICGDRVAVDGRAREDTVVPARAVEVIDVLRDLGICSQSHGKVVDRQPHDRDDIDLADGQ